MFQFGPHFTTTTNKTESFTTSAPTSTPTSTQPAKYNPDQAPFIPNYLHKYMDLWVWDWDDTLIDTSAYKRHSMSPDFIKYKLSDRELDEDWPHWRFFRSLIYYLVENGKRVGIASFGTYVIIRAYMDRIFGSGQQLFIKANIYATCYDINCNRDYSTTPVNKNSYIQRLMNHYRITDTSHVILFDDMPSNIADATQFGVLAIQMGNLNTNTGRYESDISGLFGAHTLYDFQKRYENTCTLQGVNPKTGYGFGGPSMAFGQLGDRKYWKRKQQNDGEIYTRVLNPNFKTSHFADSPGDKSRSDKSRGDKSRDDKSTGDKSTGDKSTGDKSRGDKSTGDKSRGDKSTGDKSPAKLGKDIGSDPRLDPRDYGFNDNIANITENMPENNYNKILKDKEGFTNNPGCMSCKNPVSTWMVIAFFLFMVLLIIAFIRYG